MSRTLKKLSLVAVALVIASVLPGCRTPKIKDDYRGLPPPSEVGMGTLGDDTQIAFPEGPSEWQDPNVPFVDAEAGLGTVAPGTEKRWEGVAVYFAYDRSTIGESERPKVETLAQYLQQHNTYYVIVEGHCDDRGSDEYNRALGERRALAVRDYLVALGVADNRIQTVGYGEEKPAVPDATSEAQHAKNRRAEFLIGVK